MEKRLQQRLIGAAVIIALAVIFLPMLLNGGGSSEKVSMKMQIPPEPTYTFNGAAQPPAPAGTVAVEPVQITPAPGATSQNAPATTTVTSTSSAPVAAQPVNKPAAPSIETPAAPAPTPAPKVVEPKVTASQPAPKVAEPTVTAPQPLPAQNEAAPAGKPVTPAWVIQVASFSQQSAAIKLRDRMRQGGFAAYIDRFDDKSRNTVYYRVRVGPKLSRSVAEEQQAKIEKIYKIKGLLVPYQ